MQQVTNFFCPKCGAKMAKRQIDRRFGTVFPVLRDRLDLTIDNAVASRKFLPELRELATKVANKIFENHPELDRFNLVWIHCHFCHYSTFVAPDIPEQTSLHVILPSSEDYGQVLRDYETVKGDSPYKYSTGFGAVVLLGIGCASVLVLLFLFYILGFLLPT